MPGRRIDGKDHVYFDPLCRILTSEQLSGVIAHELGHFKGADTKFLGGHPNPAIDGYLKTGQREDHSGR